MGLKKLARKMAGKKTYVIAAGTIIGAAWSAYTGQISTVDAVKLAVDAALAAAIRNGIPKVLQ